MSRAPVHARVHALVAAAALSVSGTCLAPARSDAVGERIGYGVFSSGGTLSTDGEVVARVTVGQTVLGSGRDAGGGGLIGFWYLAGSGGSTSRVVPVALLLGAPAPNPFRAATSLSYALPKAGPVRLSIFDLSGRRVRELVDQVVGAGVYQASWDGRDEGGRLLPSGIYYCRLEAAGDAANEKVTRLE